MSPQAYSLAAALVVVLHLVFVAFAVTGAALLWRWPRLAWAHLPAVAWAGYVELAGRACPLTPLELRLRAAAGLGGYSGDFLSHYVLPLLYPAHLTQGVQVMLGAGVLVLNLVLYAAWLHSRGPDPGRGR